MPPLSPPPHLSYFVSSSNDMLRCSEFPPLRKQSFSGRIRKHRRLLSARTRRTKASAYVCGQQRNHACPSHSPGGCPRRDTAHGEWCRSHPTHCAHGSGKGAHRTQLEQKSALLVARIERSGLAATKAHHSVAAAEPELTNPSAEIQILVQKFVRLHQ